MALPQHLCAEVRAFAQQSSDLGPSLLLSKYALAGRGNGGREDPPKTVSIKQVCKARPKGEARMPWLRHPKAHVLWMKSGGRLIVNQAGGILENANLCLHPFTGRPYIPGSALKGVAGHTAWDQWNEESDPILKRTYAQAIAEVFGFPTLAKDLDQFLIEVFPELYKDAHLSGSVVFLDAHPHGPAPLVLEITNSHHAKYYGGKGTVAASDTENPVPNFFPAVEAGATFAFVLTPGRRFSTFAKEHQQLYWTFASGWLEEALTQRGIGAKTAAGFGWFRLDADAAKAWQTEKAKEAEQAKIASIAQAEKAKLASLPPDQQAKTEFLAMAQEPFALAAKTLADASPEKQKGFLLCILDAGKKEWWKTLKKKAQKFPVDAALVQTLQTLSKTHGIQLP